jgi:signal transduction histidine kinase
LSDPSPPEPGGAPRGRRSAFAQLAAVYAAAFAICALLFVGGAAELVRLKNLERAEALIAADREAVLDKIGDGAPELRIGKAMAIVLARSARRDNPRVYLVEQKGRRLAGRLIGPERPSGSDGLLHAHATTLDGRQVPALASRADLGGGGALYIGRLAEDPSGELIRIAAGAFLFAALSGLVVGPWASRRILRRVSAVNEACDKVKSGDLAARAPGADANDEFGALSGHVNGMLDRIAGLVVGLRDVSNRVAHDLRTPMARLKTDLQAAAKASTLEEARSLAGAAAAETDEILQTFEALLDIAEVEAGSDGGLEPVRLDEAAASAVDLYEAVAEDRGVALRFSPEPAPILGERTLIVRLAANLIDNAIKFSPPGSQVRVLATASGEECLLAVEDSGPGIPERERETVMRRFSRGSGSGSTPGHGLGLALVAAVAKRHGARIALEDLAPGLRVRVTFRRFRND